MTTTECYTKPSNNGFVSKSESRMNPNKPTGVNTRARSAIFVTQLRRAACGARAQRGTPEVLYPRTFISRPTAAVKRHLNRACVYVTPHLLLRSKSRVFRPLLNNYYTFKYNDVMYRHTMM
ncbi:hypothetical protein EVAR_93685_1 [Eumeta japonica]|uniref:Uncharacterized protein n=1 Tax=Eumeta variegata TaxID=151549 RepID=A0A4C1U2M5_EUMVA|nr:hypothetical protein EVAR_93685_1 [Eumeta japonica]